MARICATWACNVRHAGHPQGRGRPLPMSSEEFSWHNATLVAAAGDIDLTNDNTIIVAVVAGVGVLALIMAAVFRAEVLRSAEGTEKMQEIGLAVQEGAAAYLGRMFKTLAVVRDPGLRAAVPAARRHRHPDRPVGVLPAGRGLLRDDRLPRHVAGDPRQHPGGRGRPERRPREGDAHRVPHRRHGRHADGRPGPARRCRRRPDLPGSGALSARRLRLRRGSARDVHARRRRHLHQGRRRRRRPGRQGRAEHPRGRSAQRRHDRRQRRRQRRRLRGHGRRPVRVVRGDPRRGPDPRLGRLRRAGPGLPAHRAGHRCPDRDRRRLHHPAARRRGRTDHDQPGVLRLGVHLGDRHLDRRLVLPAGLVRGPRLRRHRGRQPARLAVLPGR